MGNSSFRNRASIRNFLLKAGSLVVGSSVVIGSLGFILSDVLSIVVFQNKNLKPYIVAVSIFLAPFAVLKLGCGFLRAVGRIREFAFYQHVAVFFVSTLALCAFVLLDYEEPFTGASFYLGIAVAFLFILRAIYKNIFVRSASRNSVPLKRILEVSMPMLFTSASALVMSWADIVILGIFRSESEVGVFSMATKFASFSTIGLVVVSAVIAPRFSEVDSSGDKSLQNLNIEKSCRLSWMLSLPVVLLLVAVSPIMLNAVGDLFFQSYYPMLILLLGHTIHALSGPCGVFLNMTGHQSVLLKAILLSIILNLGLNLILVQKYGMFGVSIATTTSWIASNFLVTYIVLKKTGHIFPLARIFIRASS